MYKRDYFSIILLSLVLFSGCREREQANATEIIKPDGPEKTNQERAEKAPVDSPEIKACAYLIYEDGSLSSFDVLNESKILWNVIIGSGDAEKPSRKTLLNVNGDLENVSIKVVNGKRLIIDTTHIPGNSFEYVIKNTGCALVYVDVKKNKQLVCSDSIEFHCGE